MNKVIFTSINREDSLDMVLRLAAENIPLTEAEFHCFCDANNGTVLSPADLEHGFGINVIDSQPDGLGEKWDVDLVALTRKLDALPLLQKLTLLAAKDGFFRGSNSRKQ